MPLFQLAVVSLLLTAKFLPKLVRLREIPEFYVRERLAVFLSLQAFIDSLRAQTVVWYTDNQNVARIVNIGPKFQLCSGWF